MASSGILCKAFKSDFTVPLSGRTSCTRGLRVFVCEFSSSEECKRFLLHNVVYAYVCKICEEKFGGCWWSF